MVANLGGRVRNPTVQRSPVKKFKVFVNVEIAPVQRTGLPLTGITKRISRVQESCDCSARKYGYRLHGRVQQPPAGQHRFPTGRGQVSLDSAEGTPAADQASFPKPSGAQSKERSRPWEQALDSPGPKRPAKSCRFIGQPLQRQAIEGSRTRMRTPRPQTTIRSGVRIGDSVRALVSASLTPTNEIAQLLLYSVRGLCARWHCHGFGTDVVADSRFNGVRCIQLEHCLHLVRRGQ